MPPQIYSLPECLSLSLDSPLDRVSISPKVQSAMWLVHEEFRKPPLQQSICASFLGFSLDNNALQGGEAESSYELVVALVAREPGCETAMCQIGL